jgi:predicted dehydrogenase
MSITMGMIGLTHPHSAGHLRTLDLLPEVREVVLYDPEPGAHEAAHSHTAKAGDSYTELDRLLGREDISAVLIALPTSETPAAIVRAVTAGKHVLSEKPVGRSADDLAPVIRALEETRRCFGVHYTWRRHPAILKLRELIGGGAVGRLLSVEMRMVTSQVGFRDPSHWLFRREVSGGGVASWLGCHWLDALRFVSGEEVESVAALAGTLSGESISVEDVATVSFRMAGGALGTLHAGYVLAEGRHGYEGATMDTALIFRGAHGRAEYIKAADGQQGVVLQSRAPGWESAEKQTFLYNLTPSRAYGGMHGIGFVREFLRATHGDGASPATIEDALRVVELLDAIYASSESDRRIRIERRPCPSPGGVPAR